MSVVHPHFEYPEDCLTIEGAIWWRDHYDLFLRCLTLPKYHKPYFGSNLSSNLIIYPPECDRMENILNGRKPKPNGARLGSSDGKSLPLQWINIPLTDQDIATLESEKANLEQLALAYVQLGMHGLGLSIKFDSVGKSYVVSIYGPDSSNNMQPCGVSGRAPELRDALLVSLYRFNSCLQGSFDGRSNSSTAIQPRRFS